jgi:hypothetical protein
VVMVVLPQESVLEAQISKFQVSSRISLRKNRKREQGDRGGRELTAVFVEDGSRVCGLADELLLSCLFNIVVGDACSINSKRASTTNRNRWFRELGN